MGWWGWWWEWLRRWLGNTRSVTPRKAVRPQPSLPLDAQKARHRIPAGRYMGIPTGWLTTPDQGCLCSYNRAH